MAINRLAERDARESELYGFLRKRPEEIAAERAQNEAEAAASRGRFASSTSNVVGQLAQRFNLPSDIQGASAPGIQRSVEDLKAKEREDLSLEQLRGNRENINRIFNTMTERLVQAGVDRTAAENVSRQFALDEQNRQFSSSEAEKGRQATRKGQDIKDAYAKKLIAMQQQYVNEQRAQALKSALIRSLFNTVATIGTAAAIAGTGGAAAPVVLGAAAAGGTAGAVGSQFGDKDFESV